MTKNKNRVNNPPNSPQESLHHLTQLLAQTLKKWEVQLTLDQQQKKHTFSNIEDSPEIQADVRPHLNQLHKLWDIGRDPSSDQSQPSLETENWYQILLQINQCWDIRSLINELELSASTQQELTSHYPAFLQKYLGLSPALPEQLERQLLPLRQKLDGELNKMHQTWEITQHQEKTETQGRRHFFVVFKEKIKSSIHKIVRVHTDPFFQKQQDFNAHTVALLEQMILTIDDFQQRTTRIILELTNRQFLFNLTVVRFINSFLQDIVLRRQKDFNAEVVQALQKLIQNLPDLVLERTEILLNRLHAEIEDLKSTLPADTQKKE